MRARRLLLEARRFGILLLAAGCTVGPDYEPPEPEVPDAWHQELTRGLVEGRADLRTWWTALGDPVLDRLIERAAAGNLDLRTGLERIAESRALVGLASAGKLPGVAAGASARKNRYTQDGIFGVPGFDPEINEFTAGLDASWEIDLFGRIRRNVESAEASLEATVEDYRDLLVLLYAEVAARYVDVRTLQVRIRVATGNVARQKKTLELTTNRFDAQLVPELDVRQAELNLANTEATIPSLRTALARAVHRLSVLVGEVPSALYAELGGEGDIPGAPGRVAVGLPADLLRQRPDIRQAERSLAALTAQIGVAEADLYPTLTLSGSLGVSATQLGGLGDVGPNHTYGFGPSLRWNLFSGGAIRSSIEAAGARSRQALAAYEQTVLLALEEVENSMVAFAQETERRDALSRSVDASVRSEELVQTLYLNGLADFQNVLDTQRFLAQQEDQLAVSRGDLTQAVISLYKSLGGGWSPDDGLGPDEDAPAEDAPAEDPPAEEGGAAAASPSGPGEATPGGDGSP